MSERRACMLIGFSRSSHRYVPCLDKDSKVLHRMKEILAAKPSWGAPMVHLKLRREGLVVNHKRTERIYRKAGLQIKRRKRKRRIYKPENPLPPPMTVNQRWSMDFVHDGLHDGRKFRILTIIDEFSRECLDLEVDSSLTGQRVVRVLERLRIERGLPKEIGIDQGTEFTSLALEGWASKHGVNLHFARPGDKNENAFIESFNGRLRAECLNAHWFTSLRDARQIIGAWGGEYNYDRPHTSLGGMTPKEYASCRGLKLA
jgi:Transposase and inactivated derivatives